MSVNVYLLRPYQGKRATSIMEVADEVAVNLVDSGVARYTKGRDFLVKPEFRKGNVSARSKAFKRSPKYK